MVNEPNFPFDFESSYSRNDDSCRLTCGVRCCISNGSERPFNGDGRIRCGCNAFRIRIPPPIRSRYWTIPWFIARSLLYGRGNVAWPQFSLQWCGLVVRYRMPLHRRQSLSRLYRSSYYETRPYRICWTHDDHGARWWICIRTLLCCNHCRCDDKRSKCDFHRSGDYLNVILTIDWLINA